MFTKAQLVEWFSDRYTDMQVIDALRVMRDHGAEVDPDSDSFSPDITEDLEKIFELAGAAINSQKHLPESGQEASAILEATQIASSFMPNINRQMMAGIIRVVMEGAIAQATSITELESKVFHRALSYNRNAIAQTIKDQTQANTQYLHSLSANDAQIDKLLSGYGIETVDVDAFLADVKALGTSLRSDVKALKAAFHNQPEFNIDAFLEEMGE